MRAKDALDFPAIIREVRKSLGETQEQFAARFKSHANTVSRWESGNYQAPYAVLSFVLRRKFGKVKCPLCNGTGEV
jgi:transcriptional regulator with XRE-family HTH domain